MIGPGRPDKAASELGGRTGGTGIQAGAERGQAQA